MHLRFDLLALIAALEFLGAMAAFVPRGQVPATFLTTTTTATTTTTPTAAVITSTTRRVSMTAEASTGATTKPTGTSFLPEEAVERAKKGNPIEKLKLQKDGTAAFMDVYEYARQIREGTLSWEEVEKNDLESVRAKQADRIQQ
jgi:guanyl-specific ribonuclease Sa